MVGRATLAMALSSTVMAIASHTETAAYQRCGEGSPSSKTRPERSAVAPSAVTVVELSISVPWTRMRAAGQRPAWRPGSPQRASGAGAALAGAGAVVARAGRGASAELEGGKIAVPATMYQVRNSAQTNAPGT